MIFAMDGISGDEHELGVKETALSKGSLACLPFALKYTLSLSSKVHYLNIFGKTAENKDSLPYSYSVQQWDSQGEFS